MFRLKIFLYFLCLILFSLLVYSKIAYQVSGRVFADGKVVKGVRICATNEKTMKESICDTNSDGSFILFLEPSIYSIYCLGLEGYVIPKARKINVTNKNIYNLNFYLEKGGRISGRVYIKDKNIPIPNAELTAINESSVSIAATDNDGRYLLDGLAQSESTMVIMSAPGFEIIKKQNIKVFSGQTTENIDFELQANISLSGRILEKGSNAPVKEVNIMIAGKGMLFQTSSRDDGTYEFYNIPTGTYKITCANPFYRIYQQDIEIIKGKTMTLNIYLEKLSDEEIKSKKYFGVEMPKIIKK